MEKIFAGLLFSLLDCVVSLNVYSQDSGVVFRHPSNWRQLCVEAKATHKYIFLDCYATWCGPCKSMDKNVYPVDSVGEVLNRDFISVRVQMDTAKRDTGLVMAWYGDAAAIRGQYNVVEYPSFLFFDQYGNIVHKGVGYYRPGDFIKLAKQATDPHRQYFTLLREYKNGRLEKENYPFFVGTATALKDTGVGRLAAREYVNGYLRYLPAVQFYTEPNILFVAGALSQSYIKAGDAGFQLFLGHEKAIDSVMKKPRYAEAVVEFAILEAEVYPHLLSEKYEPLTDHPDWDGFERDIREKYGNSYAEHGVLFLKERWFKWRKEWTECVESIMNIMNKYSSEVGDFDKNSYAYYVFLYGTKKESLEEAVTWVQAVLKDDPTWADAIDTYANLLYRLGKTEEGLALEQKAAMLSPKEVGIRHNLGKMEKGVPTWMVK